MAVTTSAIATRIANEIPGVSVGLAYGIILWIVGPLILMPAWLGVVADPAMFGMIFRLDVRTPSSSFAGHVICGYVAGITFDAFRANNPLEPVERVSEAGRVPA